jgi:predicted acyltransferase
MLERAPIAPEEPTLRDVGSPPRSGEPAASVAPQPGRPHAERLVSLDAFRGIAIAGMILINNPGRWHPVYAPLQHAEWNGCTAADLIFPFFLFIVGVAITYSVVPRQRRGDSRLDLGAKILRRTLVIFGLGILLNALPFFDWSTLRIPGVLQRIAMCYFLTALLVLVTGIRGQSVALALLLVGYWAAMVLVPVPGHTAGTLQPGTNLAAYVDSALLSGHLLHRRWDSEGVLGTLPAIGTTLTGVLAGYWLQSPRSTLRRVAGLFAIGDLAILLGLAMDGVFPINKNLWTSSYVVFTTGVALNLLGLCYWLIDINGYTRWAKPFVIYGTNPLSAYVLSSLMAKGMVLWRVAPFGSSKVVLRKYLFESCFLPFASPVAASFLYALTYVLFWLALMAILYRKRIFIKI